MAELPSGTVTFLFTDIEGSTRLLARLGDRYVDVLSEHHRVLRAAFEACHGREVHTEGDAFFVAFGRATDAVGAAARVQQTLAVASWPDGARVRVRMGIHSGEADVWLDDYVGLNVHRAARICAAAHGGQVLISGPTRQLIGDWLPPGVALRDLGEHWLKDLDRPEHLFQLVIDDLPVDFPRVRSASPASAAAGGLPPSPNRTIGREDDVRAIAERLCSGDVRLLTLTGPGGVGKTRLGSEAAAAVRHQFADGVCFVSLAAVRHPEDVPSALVQRLATVPIGGETAEQTSIRFLSAKKLLLVLDNLEQLLPDGRFVAELVSACPGLTVLATSREPLALVGEQRYKVAPLALPNGELGVDALARVPAVALFVERARAHEPRFALTQDNAAAVVEICRRMDGLPLAIELAAARCTVLSPEEIAARLDATLAVLGRGPRDAPARQQTLRATIDWSHQLLRDDAEKQCFARFAVFAGGATVAAAQAVTGAELDVLDDLLSKSLLARRQTPARHERLVMLETIRAYADERLATAVDVDDVHESHYRYYLALAQRHGTERALWGADAREHLARLDAEIDNLHAALRWAVKRPTAQRALAMIAALATYWLMRDRYVDAVSWVDHALTLPGADADPALRLTALRTKARCLWQVGPEQPAVVAAVEALARRLGDPVVLSQALQLRVDQEMFHERLDAADAVADEALHWANAAGDDWEIAKASRGKANAAASVHDLRERVHTAAQLLGDVGNTYQLARLLSDAAYGALCLGSERDAADLAARAAAITRTLDSPFLRMMTTGNAGLAALHTGQTNTASQALREALRLCRDLVIRFGLSTGLCGLAAVAVLNGDDERAATLVGASDTHRYHKPPDPVEARLDQTFFAPARTRYGHKRWTTAARHGRALGYDDAIAYALGEIDGAEIADATKAAQTR